MGNVASQLLVVAALFFLPCGRAAAGPLSVAGATVTVTAPGLPERERERLADDLLRLPEVSAVRFEADDAIYRRRESGRVRAFPQRLLFQPLLADPRWPHFGGTAQHYSRLPSSHSRRVWAASFGESFPFVGWEGADSEWQFGFQAAAFTTWDLNTISDDFIDVDFLVGFPLSWRRGPVTAMARLFHISTHLGDEFILQHPATDRVNLSYEAVDARLSYDFASGFRVYGGGGYRYRRDPPDLKPAFAQAGAEYSGRSLWLKHFRPVAAVDLQQHQENGWGRTEVSVRAGVELAHRDVPSRRLALLAEVYRGRDPNGQFFLESISYRGLGLHLFF